MLKVISLDREKKMTRVEKYIKFETISAHTQATTKIACDL